MILRRYIAPNLLDDSKTGDRPGPQEVRERPALAGIRAIHNVDASVNRGRSQIDVRKVWQIPAKAKQIRSRDNGVSCHLTLNNHITLMDEWVLKAFLEILDRCRTGRRGRQNVWKDRCSGGCAAYRADNLTGGQACVDQR